MTDPVLTADPIKQNLTSPGSEPAGDVLPGDLSRAALRDHLRVGQADEQEERKGGPRDRLDGERQGRHVVTAIVSAIALNTPCVASAG